MPQELYLDTLQNPPILLRLRVMAIQSPLDVRDLFVSYHPVLHYMLLSKQQVSLIVCHYNFANFVCWTDHQISLLYLLSQAS